MSQIKNYMDLLLTEFDAINCSRKVKSKADNTRRNCELNKTRSSSNNESRIGNRTVEQEAADNKEPLESKYGQMYLISRTPISILQEIFELEMGGLKTREPQCSRHNSSIEVAKKFPIIWEVGRLMRYP